MNDKDHSWLTNFPHPGLERTHTPGTPRVLGPLVILAMQVSNRSGIILHFSFLYLQLHFVTLVLFFLVGPSAYTSPATSQYPAGQGRPSLTDSYQGYPGQDQGYQGQDQGQYPGQEDNYQGHDGQYHGQEDMYGGHPEQQYGTYHPYDPNMSNSVFEDGDDGYGGQVDYPGGLTPLPGTLGSVSHTPQPREAPRAVFDDEEDQEPMPAGHPNHPIRVNKPLSSVGSSDHNRNNQNPQNSGLFLFSYFCFLTFISFYFLSIFHCSSST